MAEDTDGATPPPTTLGEALELASKELTCSWERLVTEVQGDLDAAASGTLGLERLFTYGPRMMRVGFLNLVDLATTFSDNLVMLTTTPQDATTEDRVAACVTVQIPANSAATVVARDLLGNLTGRTAPARRVKVTPSTYAAESNTRAEQVDIELATFGLPVDVYSGTLCVQCEDGSMAEFPYDVPVADLP